MELVEEVKELLRETAKELKGSACRLFMARTVRALGEGSQEPTPKKLPDTDAIFAQMKLLNEEADAASDTLRISMDAKATVKVGPFARGGKSRVSTKAADHDFQPAATVTPVGIFLPASGKWFVDIAYRAPDLRDG
jgi:hypothetical protein